jgi:DnaK suppressor protein
MVKYTVYLQEEGTDMENQATDLHILQLEQQKEQVELEIGRYEEQLRVQIDPDVDEADPDLTTQAITVALLENARRKFESIKRALIQARNGGYGICEACGQPIDPERLEIFPQATLCVPCKSKRERNGHSNGYRKAA